MTKEQPYYLEHLKTTAPSIAFCVSRTPDENFRWDGDGPDSAEDGYIAYDVDVTARMIVNGEIVCGSASLGGSYYEPDEPLGEVHGYLPQMLEEAATELKQTHTANWEQLTAAILYLKQVMQNEYDKQTKERNQ